MPVCDKCLVPYGEEQMGRYCPECGFKECWGCSQFEDNHECDPEDVRREDSRCRECWGAGEVQINGPYEWETCPSCGGDGYVQDERLERDPN